MVGIHQLGVKFGRKFTQKMQLAGIPASQLPSIQRCNEMKVDCAFGEQDCIVMKKLPTDRNTTLGGFAARVRESDFAFHQFQKTGRRIPCVCGIVFGTPGKCQ